MVGTGAITVEAHKRFPGVFVTNNRHDTSICTRCVAGEGEALANTSSAFTAQEVGGRGGDKTIMCPATGACTIKAPQPREKKEESLEAGEEDASGAYLKWNPFHCPIAASLIGGIEALKINPGDHVVYVHYNPSWLKMPKTLEAAVAAVGEEKDERVFCVSAVGHALCITARHLSHVVGPTGRVTIVELDEEHAAFLQTYVRTHEASMPNVTVEYNADLLGFFCPSSSAAPQRTTAELAEMDQADMVPRAVPLVFSGSSKRADVFVMDCPGIPEECVEPMVTAMKLGRQFAPAEEAKPAIFAMVMDGRGAAVRDVEKAAALLGAGDFSTGQVSDWKTKSDVWEAAGLPDSPGSRPPEHRYALAVEAARNFGLKLREQLTLEPFFYDRALLLGLME